VCSRSSAPPPAGRNYARRKCRLPVRLLVYTYHTIWLQPVTSRARRARGANGPRMSRSPDGLHRLRLRRRDFGRLALGAGALAGVAPRFAGAATVAQAAPAPSAPLNVPLNVPPNVLGAVDAADQFGANEAFKAMPFGRQSGARWTRWTVQWFNVQ